MMNQQQGGFMQDTVTATICRCGWVSVAPSFGDSVEMFNEHSNGEEGKHTPSTVMGVSSPVPADAMAYFLRKSHILAAESRALDNLERWKDKGEPVRVTAPVSSFFGRLVDRIMGPVADVHYGERR
jgi:hypothetical protein